MLHEFQYEEDWIGEVRFLTQTRVELAGIVVSLQASGGEDQGFQVPAHHAPFVSIGEPEVVLCCRYGPIPGDLLGGEVLFDTHDMWSLHRNHRGLVWRQMSVSMKGDPERLALLPPNYCSGEMYIASSAADGGELGYPLHHPFDKFLFANLLADRGCVACHACGVDDGGRGLLFVGESGAGKSTMAGLWAGRPGVTVLSDERTIARWWESRFFLFGTPWYGSAGIVSPARVPLSAIFFLRHGTENRVTPLDRSQVIKQLLVCTYLPFWSASRIDRSLQLFDDLSQAVPCYELAYTPDEGVIGFLEDVVDPPSLPR